jgi:hypothetical protein
MNESPAWNVKLPCGRWICVTSENESLAPYYTERRGPKDLGHARSSAFDANKRLGWVHTVYVNDDVPGPSRKYPK